MLMRIYVRGSVTGASVMFTAAGLALGAKLGIGLAFFVIAAVLLGYMTYRDVSRIAELDACRAGAFKEAKQVMAFISEEREARAAADDAESHYYRDALDAESRALKQAQLALQDVTIRDRGLWGEVD